MLKLKMAISNGNGSLRSRFQGCLLGGVSGDCLGAPFETHGVPKNPLQSLTKYFDKMGTEIKDKDYLSFTDDTAMARSVAQSLIDTNGKFSSRDLAKKFGAEYAKEPNRGYGPMAIKVLEVLGTDLEDVFQPARDQFDGQGSYGNGAGMRVAPVGLCSPEKFEEMIEVARESAWLTHTNFLGYAGAILQACAVHLALHADPATFDLDTFLRKLLEVMEKEEATFAEGSKQDGGSPPQKMQKSEGKTNTEYSRRLKLIKPLLEEDADVKKVAKELGNTIRAHESVPSAVYAFLRCLKPVKGVSSQTALERTILYAIALDGDTDTIGSMAGAIAGAFYGADQVPTAWLTVCEGTEHAMQQADKLYDVFYGDTDPE